MSVKVVYAGSMIEAEELPYQRAPLHDCDDYENRKTILGSHPSFPRMLCYGPT